MKIFYLPLGICSILCIIGQVLSAPADKTLSFVASSTEPSTIAKDGKEGTVVEAPKAPKIYQMHIKSNISNRFANTTITSKVKNVATQAQEATFSVILPKEAFISGFIMEVGGKNYTAYVKEKEEAKKQYDEAVASGLGAAHVAVSARDSNKFTVSVNIEPETKAAFYLTYEELLKRKDGHYENVINIHPGQPVRDLSVEVLINEGRKITDVRAPPLRSGNEIGSDNDELDPRADIQTLSDTSVVVQFSPNEERQKQLAHLMKTVEDNGLSGQFVVQYDVERDPKGGEVLVRDGYFVHFFAPTDLEPLPKHVVFVLDVSGSMDGIKLEQLKEAMLKILEELHEKDLFSLVQFSDDVQVINLDNTTDSRWLTEDNCAMTPGAVKEANFPKAYPATVDYISKAKESIKKLDTIGGTNIIMPIEVGLELVKMARENKVDSIDRQPLLIFLTDGEPNVCESNTESITKKVTEKNIGLKKSPIFTLSFGYGANKDFLQKLSLRNMGFSKHIYEASDAALQLQDFYNQISSPLLSDVTFKYESSETTEVTKTYFPILYGGSELIIAGRWNEAVPDSLPTVDGISSTGLVSLTPRVENSNSNIERLWAYLTVKQLLEKKEITDDNVEEIKKRALDLCLKYSFVTPLSSLVVVKPNATNSVDAEEASASRNQFPQANYYSGAGFGGVASAGIPLSMSNNNYNQIDFRISADYDQNMFFSGAVPQGAFNPPTYIPAISIRTTTAPVPKPTTDFSPFPNSLDAALPWLKTILNDKGVVNLPEGSYKLGMNETITSNDPCKNSPSGTLGNCTLLKDCAGVHAQLTSVDVYVKHFCVLNNEYAGVCCPAPVFIPRV